MAFFELSAFGDAPLIGPHDRAAQRLHRTVQKNGVVRGAVKRKSADVSEFHSLRLKLAERQTHGGIPVGGVLLRPAGMLVMRGVFHGRIAEHKTRAVDRGDLAAAGTEVYAEKNGVVAVHVTLPSCAADPCKR